MTTTAAASAAVSTVAEQRSQTMSDESHFDDVNWALDQAGKFQKLKMKRGLEHTGISKLA